jgi:O-antigen ligase
MPLSAQQLRPYRAPTLFNPGFGPGPEVTIGAALAAGGALLVMLDSGSATVELAPFGLLGVLILIWCARLATVAPLWLIFALALEETLPYTNLIPVDPESRWWLRYPFLIALCFPAIPWVWRSQLVRRGGFRLFIGYFAWAALTIAWSLAPGVSAGRLVPDVLLFVALVLVVESIRERRDEERLFARLMLGCAIVLGLIAITALAFPTNVFREGDDPAIGVYNWVLDDAGILRFSGIFDAPNEIGGLAVATVGAGLSYLCVARAGQWRLRLAVLGCIAASLTFAVMADSRSALAAIVVGLAAYALWRYRARGLALCVALMIAAAIGYGAMGGDRNVYVGRNLATLTGRTEAWQFEIQKLRDNPLLGYGYGVEGAIFQDRYFPNWETFWNRGANTPLHNGYLSVAIGLGLPALLLWIFIFMRPWVAVFRRPEDPWSLKPIFFFVVIPMLLVGLDETGVAEPRYVKGLLLFVCWMMAERQRLTQLRQTEPAKLIPDHRFARLLSRSAAALTITMVVAVGIARSALAADYYVDSIAGNDSSSGQSPASAWRSLEKVDRYEFHHGDVVHLRRGSTWRETLEPRAAGHANFRGVTFEPYGSGSLPTINGSDALTGWTRVDQVTWAVREYRPVYNVFVDGQPGWGLMHAACLASFNCVHSPLAPPVRGKTCAIGPMRPGSWHWSGPSAALAEIPNTLYIWLPDGSDPATHLVEAVTRPYGIHGWVQSNQLDSVEFDGLRIIETGLRGISLESEDTAGSRGGGQGISGLVVRNCVVERTGTGPFDDGRYGNAITIINATAPVIENNRVSYAGNHGNGINVQNANGARIRNNAVDHWNHNGIDVKGSEDVLVMGNSAVDQPALGAAYYTEYSSNVTFENNRAQRVHNGFQVALGSSARLLNNVIDSAGTAVHMGPHAASLNLGGNQISDCHTTVEGDGNGVIHRDASNVRPPIALGVPNP